MSLLQSSPPNLFHLELELEDGGGHDRRQEDMASCADPVVRRPKEEASSSASASASAAKLTSPKPKKRRRRRGRGEDCDDPHLQQPFPVPISSLSGVPASNAIWRWFRGRIAQDSAVVEVTDPEEEASNLARMGFFGTWPEETTDKYAFVAVEDVDPKILTKEDLEKPSRSGDEPEVEIVEVESDAAAGAGGALRLDPCEAYFLSYALGCLLVRDSSDAELDLDELWSAFCESDPDFPRLYRVYHHFRAKGWVVRQGTKFGADFLLYKHGPPFYHASYSVKVERAGGDSEATSMDFLAGLNRVTETAGKELLLARITEAEDLTANSMSSPACLKMMAVTETLIKRWVPSQERNVEQNE